MAKLSCDICGGNLIFIDDLDNLTCEICGVKYSKEAIKQKLANSGESNVQSPAVIDSEKEKLIIRAEGFVVIKQYDKAVAAYWDLIDKYPSDVDLQLKYLDLCVNFYFDEYNKFINIFNILKNSSNINLNQYVDKLYDNILNNDNYDVYNLFSGTHCSNYLVFKDFIIKSRLEPIFSKKQIDNIIICAEHNSKAVYKLLDVYNNKITDEDSCYFVVGNFALCYRYVTRSVKLKKYNKKTMNILAEIYNNHYIGLCIYCGGKLKGIVKKSCVECGKSNDDYYDVVKKLELELYS